MPQFDNTVITTAGSRIIQQSLADEGSIKWSRLVTSSHAFEDTVDLRSVTSIPNIKQEAEYGDFTVYLSSVGDVTVKHYFSNREVTVGYTCETIALYAEYESEEVVACIIRSTAHDTIPPYDGKNPSGVSVTLALRFQDTPDFEVIFSDAGTVSDADFAHYQAWVAKEYVTKVEHESTLDEIGDPALLAKLSEEGATNWDSGNLDFRKHESDITSEEGRHGIRYWQEKLEIKVDNEWVEFKSAGIKIYGIEIDESNSNPETSVTYTDSAVGFTPASGNNGAFNWGSWESIIKDEFEIRPCVLNNPAKTVNYYLDYDDYTKKATGGASVLTGADGDVMIEFGTDIYTKWTVIGDKHHIQLSIKPFEGATKNAFETEGGYNQFGYYPLLLTQKLFQMIFKNRDSQTALGRGYVDENSDYITTGNTNTKGFMFGETTGKQQMKFLGIEDYWGNKYQWIDGLVTNATHDILISNSNFNDSGSGYTSHSSGISAGTWGYISTVQGGNDKGFIIKGSAGSATTHYCDFCDLNSGRVARFGGDHLDGSDAGFARLRLNNVSGNSDASLGARLTCVNNGKLYIGAYLGTTQSGKLRSVSGTTPSDNKTIGTFRNEARANNV